MASETNYGRERSRTGPKKSLRGYETKSKEVRRRTLNAQRAEETRCRSADPGVLAEVQLAKRYSAAERALSAVTGKGERMEKK